MSIFREATREWLERLESELSAISPAATVGIEESGTYPLANHTPGGVTLTSANICATLQAAVDAAQAAGGGTVLIPPGTWAPTLGQMATVNISTAPIVIAGCVGTKLYAPTGWADEILVFSGTVDGGVQSLTLGYATADASNVGDVIAFSTTTRLRLADLLITHATAGVGILGSTSTYYRAYNVIITGCADPTVYTNVVESPGISAGIRQVSPVADLTPTSDLVVDLGTGQNFHLDISADSYISFVGGEVGQSGRIFVTQDSVGSRVASFRSSSTRRCIRTMSTVPITDPGTTAIFSYEICSAGAAPVVYLLSATNQWTSATAINTLHLALSGDGGKLYTSPGTGARVLQSTDLGVTWTLVPEVVGGVVLADATGANLVCAQAHVAGYPKTSSDSGATWTTQTGGTSVRDFTGACDSDASVIVLCPSASAYVRVSSDSGVTWANATAAGAATWRNACMSATGLYIYISTNSGYVWKSADSGATWAQVTAGGSRAWTGLACSSDGAIVYGCVSTSGTVVYYSTDYGVTWGTRTAFASSVAARGVATSADGAKVYVGDSTGLVCRYSSDSGAAWATSGGMVGRTIYQIRCDTTGVEVVALTLYGTYAVSSDSGATFTERFM